MPRDRAACAGIVPASPHTTMPVHIGSKFTGKPAAHADTTTGVYWEALPKIQGDALNIQHALLTQPKLRQVTGRVFRAREKLPTLVGMQK